MTKQKTLPDLVLYVALKGLIANHPWPSKRPYLISYSMLLSKDWWQTVLKGGSSIEHTILLVVATSLGVATVIFRKGDFLLKWKP